MKTTHSPRALWHAICKPILCLALPALAMSSCTNDDAHGTTEPPAGDRVALSITSAAPEQVRAAGTTWHAADAIGVYMLTEGTTTAVDNQRNRHYTNTAQAGPVATFNPAAPTETVWYPPTGADVEVLAYYPYRTLATEAAQAGVLTLNMTAQTDLPALDLMTATRVTGSKDHPQVALRFRHRLTRLNISLVRDASAAGVDLSQALLTLTGVHTTATYNLFTDQLTPTGDAAELSLPLSAGGTAATAIVLPAEAGAGIAFRIEAGGKTFTAALPADVALAPGKEAKVKITVRQIQPIITAEVDDWADGPTVAAPAVGFDLPADPETGLPALTRFTLTRNAGTPTQASAQYTYNAEMSRWTAVPAPFYLDDLKEDDRFSATHTPALADPLTGLADELAAPATAVGPGGKLALTFGHVNGQMEFAVAPSPEFPAAVAGARITLGLPGKELTFTPGQVLLAVPCQDLTLEATVTLATGATYPARITGFTVEAGRKTLVTITLHPTAATVKVDITPWQEGFHGSAEGAIALSPSDLTKLPGTGTIQLSCGTAQATYTWNGTALTTDAPLYWEQLPQAGPYTFALTYTPDATGTPAKDVLTGTATLQTWGAPIDFGQLQHLNAQVEYALAPGAGFSGDLTDARILIGTQTFAAGTVYIIEPEAENSKEIRVVLKNGREYPATLAAFKAEAGRKTIVTITLKATQVSGIKADVAPWGTAAGQSAEGAITLSPSDLSNLPGSGDIELTCGTLTALYTWNGTALTADTPLYWDDLTGVGPFSFKITYTPHATGTPAKDVLKGNATVATWGAPIDFGQLQHQNAQVEFALAPGTGFTADLTGAQILIDLSTQTSFEAGTTYLIEPEAAGSKEIRVKLKNGREYPATLASFKAEAGKKTIVTITLKGTGVSGIKADVAPWGTSAGQGTTGAIALNPSDLSKLPGAGKIEITIGTASSTYTWNGTALTSDAPIYWESLPEAGPYNFAITYTPDAIGTPEKDILTGTATVATWGAVIDFGQLQHQNAQVEYTLAPGAGFSGDLTDATITIGTQTFEAGKAYIIQPEAGSAKNVVVKLKNGREYPATLASFKAEAGKKTIVTITLKGTGISGIKADVAPWGTSAGQGTNAAIALSPSDLSNLPGAGKLEITIGTASSTYTWNGTALTTDAPIYWESLPDAGPYNFAITYTPDAAGTPAKDILTGTATVATWGAVIDFGQLQHANAQVEFALTPGTGFSGDLADAQITIGTQTFATGTVYIIQPEAGNTKNVTVKLKNGREYPATLASFKAEAGKKTIVTITLKGTGVSGIKADVAPWGTSAGQGTTGAISLSPSDLSKLPGAGKLEITIGAASSTYTWNGTALTADSPLYWESLPEAGPYNFAITYTPDATGTPEKDILTGTATVATWGAVIDFGQLQHANAQVEFALTPGTGFTGDLADAQITIGTQTFATGKAYIIQPEAGNTKNVTVKLKNGREYPATLASFKAEAGKKTIVTITLKGTGISGIKADVAPWGTSAGQGITGAISLSPSDLSNLPGAGKLEITIGTASSTYTWNGTDLTTDAPIYWESLPEAGPYNFAITYTPDATGTPAKDVLKGTATVATWGAVIDFGQLQHANAQVEFALTPGTGFSGDLADAQITIGIQTFVAGVAYIIQPEAGSAKNVTVKLKNGREYPATLTSFKAEAGRKTIVTITLKGTGVSGIKADVAPWGTSAGQGTNAAIALSPSDLSNLPSGELFIHCGTATGTYTWNGTDLTSDSPIYWESLPDGGPYEFKIRFTPDAIGTPLKDILEGTATVAAWGDVINFGQLQHRNAQVEFALVRGAGFTASLADATIVIDLGSQDSFLPGTEYILASQAAATKPVKVRLANSREYPATLTGFEIAAGRKTKITITLAATETTFSLQAAQWGETITGETGVKLPLNLSASDFSALPGPGNISITAHGFTGSYRWNGTTLATNTPIYWDDLPVLDRFTFGLEFTPDAPGTPAKDVLRATATGVLFGTDINLGALSHQNARLSIALQAGTGYANQAELDAAAKTLTLAGFSTPAYVMTAGEAIVAPGTLADAHIITLTMAARSYTIRLKDSFANLEAGKQYKLTATVNKTSLGGITITAIEAWDVVNGGTGTFE